MSLPTSAMLGTLALGSVGAVLAAGAALTSPSTSPRSDEQPIVVTSPSAEPCPTGTQEVDDACVKTVLAPAPVVVRAAPSSDATQEASDDPSDEPSDEPSDDATEGSHSSDDSQDDDSDEGEDAEDAEDAEDDSDDADDSDSDDDESEDEDDSDDDSGHGSDD